MVVEGSRDEPHFFEPFFKRCWNGDTVEFFICECNIHMLADKLEDQYPDFDSDDADIELLILLRALSSGNKDVLNATYTDIFLIFDFDPHHGGTRLDIVRRMLAYFNDSSDQGKMYINYPMMQSYKHLEKLPDDGFKDRMANINELTQYKATVGKSAMANVNIYKEYNYCIFASIAVHHLRKANSILTGTYAIPDADIYLNWQSIEIFDRQCEIMAAKNSIYVLNTCIFMMIDYRPKAFLKQIQDKKQNFDI